MGRLKSEGQATSETLKQDLDRAGSLLEKDDNNVFSVYKETGPNAPVRKSHEFGIEQLQSCPPFDAKSKTDTLYPEHQRWKEGLKSKRPIRSSQAYGWYQAIDNPKNGFGRTSICQDSFADKSHL